MPVNEITQSLGSWSVTLRQDTPRAILDQIGYFGHVVVHAARQFHPEMIGDGLLKTARYVGVVRAREFTGAQGGSVGQATVTGASSSAGAAGSVPDSNLFGGPGMAMWLGDEDDKGAVIEGPGIALKDVSFTEGVRELLPSSGAITEGTLHSVTGSFTGGYIYTSPRAALSDFVSYFSSELGECEWRVNGDGSLDAGTIDQLYVTTPRAIIARKAAGQDLFLRGLAGDAQTDEDVADFSTRVIVLAEGTGDAVATGAADIDPGLNPYLDIHGNPVVLTRMVSQSGTDASNAPASAVLQLNRFLKPRQAIQLSSDEMDLRGTFAVGDYVWAYDPDSGLMDTSNEAVFRGERIYPVSIRVTELTWPIIQGMGVAYRTPTGEWIDLTDYVIWEDPTNVDLVVGGISRTLLNSGGEAVGSRPKPDSSIPAAVEWILPFGLSSYQSLQGITRSEVALAWHRPSNTDGTAIIDGDHYEIRWRTSAHQILPVTWAYLQQSALEWADLVQWNGLLRSVEGPWQYTAVGFDQEQFLLSDLTPGVPYDIQIRAVDNAVPPNFGDFSAVETFETQFDPYPPSPPAPAFVASSLIAVQVTHFLGKANGGTFNLEADLHHLEVHAAYEPTFTPTEASLLGRLIATQGTLASNTPVVGTFQIAITTDVWVKVVAVDQAGNRSNPSAGAQSSAMLIDDAHISDLSVSKVTAGEITAAWILAGNIATALSGVRVGMDAFGFYGFDQNNNPTFVVDASTGDVFISGTITAKRGTAEIIMSPGTLVSDANPIQLPGLFLYANTDDVVPPASARVYSTPIGHDSTTVSPSSIVVIAGMGDSLAAGALSLTDDGGVFSYKQARGPQGGLPYPVIKDIGGRMFVDDSGAQVMMFAAGDNAGIDGGILDISPSQIAVGYSPFATPSVFNYYSILSGTQAANGPFARAFVGDGNATFFIGTSSVASGNSGTIIGYPITMIGTRIVTGAATVGVGVGATGSTTTTFTLASSTAVIGPCNLYFICVSMNP